MNGGGASPQADAPSRRAWRTLTASPDDAAEMAMAAALSDGGIPRGSHDDPPPPPWPSAARESSAARTRATAGSKNAHGRRAAGRWRRCFRSIARQTLQRWCVSGLPARCAAAASATAAVYRLLLKPRELHRTLLIVSLCRLCLFTCPCTGSPDRGQMTAKTEPACAGPTAPARPP